MYNPDPFSVSDPAEIDALLRRAPFAALITHGPEGLFASHLPLLHDPALGVLTGHLARPNPHRSLAPDGEALAIFQGANGYITPSWYPGKAEHGRAVPTWNYETVHVHGRLTWHEDKDWLLAHVAALTDRMEAHRPLPWAVDDAPADYVDRMLNGIIGVELRVERVEAKRKLSQNRSEQDRQGVIAGLSASDSLRDQALAQVMVGSEA